MDLVRAAAGALWLACAGCPYKVALTSLPENVIVELPDETVVTTPATVTFRWVPFGHQRIEATAVGYRTLRVDLRRDEIRATHFIGGTLRHPAVLLGQTRGEVRLILVPEHGPSGSWTAEELSR